MLKSEFGERFRLTLRKLCRDRLRQRAARHTVLEPVESPSEEDSDGYVPTPKKKRGEDIYTDTDSDGKRLFKMHAVLVS